MAAKTTAKRLLIIMAGIVTVFVAARTIAYLMLKEKLLPMWLSPSVSGFRLHHFVYGNMLILITSFLAIALQTKVNKNILAGTYGIGLGLILDEFPHWIGYVPELNSNAAFIPIGAAAVLVAVAMIFCLLFTEVRKEKSGAKN